MLDLTYIAYREYGHARELLEKHLSLVSFTSWFFGCWYDGQGLRWVEYERSKPPLGCDDV